MSLRTTAAMSASLDNDYGPNRGPNSADAHEVALFNGDPLIPAGDGGGVELDDTDCPGYTRVTIDSDDWPAAVDGEKTLVVTFPDTTGQWNTAATHWGLYDPAGDVWWDAAELAEPLEVTGAGDGPLLVITIQYDNNFEVA